MRLAIIQIFLLILPLKIWCQTPGKDALMDNYKFKSIKEILKDSKKINNETFDLKFFIRVLPDNGWFLKLNKDKTFNYIHWSGWGEESSILENGTYSIIHNRIKLESNKKRSALKKNKFYLVISPIDNDYARDCKLEGEIIYCLYIN